MVNAYYGNETPETEKTPHTVQDLSRKTVLNTVHDKTITESRYNGTYSGGKWVATANTKYPRETTNAFASDVPCGEFWGEILQNKNKTAKTLRDGETIYAASGDQPGEALDTLAKAIKDDMKDRNIVKIGDNILGEVIGYYDPETKGFTADAELTTEARQ